MIPTKYKKFNPEYFSKGKRSIIYTFTKNKKQYILKIEKPGIQAKERIKNEAAFLDTLNKYKIGPKLLDSNKKYICYEFLKGKLIKDYIKESKNIKPILKQILKQCFILDKLKINKKEMHNPYKHIIIYKNKATMIDFERCYYTKKPKNISQFFQYIKRLNKELNLKINEKKLLKKVKQYKKEINQKNLKEVLKEI